MGEIKKAYSVLNKLLNLRLSAKEMMAAEMSYKIDLAERVKFPKSLTRDANKFSAEWEVTTGGLAPRRRKLRSVTKQSLAQLQRDVVAARVKKTAPVKKVRRKVRKRVVKKR